MEAEADEFASYLLMPDPNLHVREMKLYSEHYGVGDHAADDSLRRLFVARTKR
jgi:Zn-dependent peptidase ImmA (M78 family)